MYFGPGDIKIIVYELCAAESTKTVKQFFKEAKHTLSFISAVTLRAHSSLRWLTGLSQWNWRTGSGGRWSEGYSVCITQDE